MFLENSFDKTESMESSLRRYSGEGSMLLTKCVEAWRSGVLVEDLLDMIETMGSLQRFLGESNVSWSGIGGRVEIWRQY